MLKSIIFSEQSDHCSKEIKDKTKSNDFYSQFPPRGSTAWHLTPGAEMVSLFPVMDSLSSNLLASDCLCVEMYVSMYVQTAEQGRSSIIGPIIFKSNQTKAD